MKKKIKSLNIKVELNKEFPLNEDDLEHTKTEIKDSIVEHLYRVGILKSMFRVSVITTEKTISMVLYEEPDYRILRTKTCKALLQYKKKDKDNDENYTWIDKAFFSAGDKTTCYNKAKDELNRLKSKSSTKKRKKRSGRTTKTKREIYLESIPKKDFELLTKLTN